MGLKTIKSCSSGKIDRVIVSREGLWKKGPLKFLCKGYSNTGGRNTDGRITIRHRASFNRLVYRKILFNRKLLNGIDCVVERIEYDPNRSARIALLKYVKDSSIKEQYCYIVATDKLKIGDIVKTSISERIDFDLSNCMPIGYIKDGTQINCLEGKIGGGAVYARSAGNAAQILGREESGKILIRLSSGEIKRFDARCLACIGVISNLDHFNASLGKAGASVWLGKRPSVRGIAMNPVDHHNGGRANGGCHFASPKGICAKGFKTRRNKRTEYTIVKRRGKNG